MIESGTRGTNVARLRGELSLDGFNVNIYSNLAIRLSTCDAKLPWVAIYY